MQKYEEKLGGGRNQLYICFAYTKHWLGPCKAAQIVKNKCSQH